MKTFILKDPQRFLTIIGLIICLIMWAVTLPSCKAPNKCNYGNKAGQGKYWKQGAKKNWHRL